MQGQEVCRVKGVVVACCSERRLIKKKMRSKKVKIIFKHSRQLIFNNIEGSTNRTHWRPYQSSCTSLLDRVVVFHQLV